MLELLSWLIRLLMALYFTLVPVESAVITPAPVVSMARVNSVIESAEVVVLESDPVQVRLDVVGYHPDGCEYPVQTQQTVNGTTISVSIYRLIPSDIGCTDVIIPYTASIPLNGVVPNGSTYTVNVNGVTRTFTLGGNMPQPTPVQTVIETVEAVFLEGFPIQIQLNVEGYHPDSCQYPVLISQSRSGSTVDVTIYREIPANVRCAGEAVPYQQTITLDGGFDPGIYTINVNGTTTTVEVPGGQAPAPGRIMTVVESVDALLLESFPVQITLNVSGYHPDGCEFPVQVIQSRAGNSVNVEIFREVPADALCPAVVVPYTEQIALGTFEPGTYTITVNGVSVTVTV